MLSNAGLPLQALAFATAPTALDAATLATAALALAAAALVPPAAWLSAHASVATKTSRGVSALYAASFAAERACGDRCLQ